MSPVASQQRSDSACAARDSCTALSPPEPWHLLGIHSDSPKGNVGTIGDVIEGHARDGPDRPSFLVADGPQLTFLDLWHQISYFRSHLRQAGFGPSSRVGVAFPEGPQLALALVAVACSAVAVPIPPNLAAEELRIRFGRLRFDAVLVLQGHPSLARIQAESQGIQVLEVAAPVGQPLRLRFTAPIKRRCSVDDSASEVACIFHSSGTTALPKLIPCSHTSMLIDARKAQIAFGLSPQDRCLCIVPVYYSQGLRGAVLTALLTGGSVAFSGCPGDMNIRKLICELKPTWYVAGPTVHLGVLERVQLEPKTVASHKLRFLVNSGAPLPSATQAGLERSLSVPVLQYYGLGEAGQVSVNHLLPGRSKPGTCGIPWPDLVIVGSDGSELPRGEAGEIWVRGPAVISGYLDPPELNQTAFVDGWFRTGDIGTLDEDGFLTLHGRMKEVINRGGEKISPAEIDAALMRHPDVVEAAAFALPHARLGEIVGAAVVLRRGARTTPLALRAYLRRELSWSKIPRRIHIRNDIPKGPTGKVLRHRLADS